MKANINVLNQLKLISIMTTNTVQATTTSTKLMNGIYTNKFNQDWEMAQHYRDAVIRIAERAENVAVADLYAIFDTETIEKRDELNKKAKRKANKRVTKQAAEFKPTGLVKPKNVQNRFREQYHAQCVAAGKPYDNAGFHTAYAALTTDVKSALSAKYDEEMKAYNVAVAAQQAQAIANGDFPEPEPDMFRRAYIFFTDDMRQATKDDKHPGLTPPQREELKNMSMTNQAKKFGEIWKTLTDDQKAKYKEQEVREKIVYECRIYDWKVRVLERQIAKAEREGLDPSQYRSELIEVQLHPPSAEERAVVGRQPNPVDVAPLVQTPVAQSEAPKKTKKVKTPAVTASS